VLKNGGLPPSWTITGDNHQGRGGQSHEPVPEKNAMKAKGLGRFEKRNGGAGGECNMDLSERQLKERSLRGRPRREELDEKG